MTAGACCDVPTDLSCDEALVILEPYFVAAQEVFIQYEMENQGSSRMRRVRLECSSSMHDTPRHFAGTTDDGKVIMVAPELVELPEETVVGILSHEFGHAMDFAYPARWWIFKDKIQFQEPIGDSAGPYKTFGVVLAQRWRDRPDDIVERTADAIAECVTGRVIGYSGPCLLQRFDRGIAPRPGGLR